MKSKKKIRVDCVQCGARYIIDEKYGGGMGRCSQCDRRFVLPIPCPAKLLHWAESTSWKRLTRFVDQSGARGHCVDTIGKFVEIFNQRRWDAEHETYREMSESGESLTLRGKAWQKTENKIQRQLLLEELMSFSPKQFERLVADIFSSIGMTAQVTGGSSDNGIDVKIWDSSGCFFAIAQCKRYSLSNKIGASQIREFAGAYLLSKASKGFYFTTSSFTRHAKRTARGYPWLKVFDGNKFVRYIRDIKYEIDAQKINS